MSKRSPERSLAIFHSSQYPSCSLHSTGIVSTFGVGPGSSERGDKICTSVDMAEEFFAKVKPSGVERVPHFYAKAERSGHCYLINPRCYLDWLEEQTECDCWDERVEQVDGKHIRLSSGKIFEGRTIVLASGAYIKEGNRFFPQHPFVNGSTIVKGSYGIFDNVDWGDSGFVFSHKSANLVYRSDNKQVVIGGTTDLGEGGGSNSEGVKEQYNTFTDFFDLPPFDSVCLGAGLRHRGVKRMPFWGRLSDHVYGILGLYKNGWSLSFLAAEEIMGAVD